MRTSPRELDESWSLDLQCTYNNTRVGKNAYNKRQYSSSSSPKSPLSFPSHSSSDIELTRALRIDTRAHVRIAAAPSNRSSGHAWPARICSSRLSADACPNFNIQLAARRCLRVLTSHGILFASQESLRRDGPVVGGFAFLFFIFMWASAQSALDHERMGSVDQQRSTRSSASVVDPQSKI